MPDTLDASGLTLQTYTELQDALQTAFQQIYGTDINLDQNSPGGQQIGIFSQAGTDIRELIAEIFASFDPDQASGSVLDQRVAINYITRNGGTYTIVPVTLTVTSTVTLQGLDANANSATGTGYTVQDDAGNQYILISSATLSAGEHTLNFRAQNVGPLSVAIGAITSPVTYVNGVTTINNATIQTTLGTNTETDAALRVRRRSSVALASYGYLLGLEGTLKNLTGVTDARVYENRTDTTANGIPPHAIWAIVEGGSPADIAQAIYTNKSPGCNLFGSLSYVVNRTNGDTFTAYYDTPTNVNLYLKFDLKPTAANQTIDDTVIASNLAALTSFNIGDIAETSSLTALAYDAIKNAGIKGVPLNLQISLDGSTWTDYLATSALDEKFALDAANITITDLSA